MTAESNVVLAIGVAYLALMVWMIVDCWKHEPSLFDRIWWTLALLIAGFVTIPIYFFTQKCGRASRRERAIALAKAAAEARRKMEIQNGLRKRDAYEMPDQPVPRTTWTALMTSRARWADGHAQELLPSDTILKFDTSWSGPFDFHGGDLGYAIERGGKIVAEYIDPTLAHVINLPKTDKSHPPVLEKTYAALKELREELRQSAHPNAEKLHQITPQKLGCMLLERQALEQAEKSGKGLNEEERKRLFFLKCLLGGDGLEPAFETGTLSLEEAEKLEAVGRFTFGQVTALIMGLGCSRGDVIRFLERVQRGEIPVEEASEFLRDCEEWQQLKLSTNESHEAFFKRKEAERERRKRNDAARN